jgi:AhpD family alkylhydroperoxidase
MGNYQDTLEDIERTLGTVPGFMKALPEDVLINDWALMKRYQFGESEIPAKYREMMGLAIAANLKCPYCQAMHLGMAKGYGATDEELSELAFLASFTSRWSAMLHAQNYDLDTFLDEAGKIGEHVNKGRKVV